MMFKDRYPAEIGVYLSILTFGLVLVISLVRLFFAIRRRFTIKVNCWFCNRNSRVLYDLRNSFLCNHCSQYNGFNTDGGYNREIPEQHYTKLNPVTNCVFSEENVYDLKKSNGLCYACNRNQELKVLQLAAFVPKNEETFDLEVDQYKESLEKAYKLCGKCERVLKRSLNKVKSSFVGRFGLAKVAQSLPKNPHLISISLWLVFGISVMNLLVALNDFRITSRTLTSVIGTSASEFVLQWLSYGLALKSMLTTHIVENPLTEELISFVQEQWKFVQNEEKSHDLREILNISATLVTVILLVALEGRQIGLHLGLLVLWSGSTLLQNHEFLTGPVDVGFVSMCDLAIALAATYMSYKGLHQRQTFKSDNLDRSFHKLELEEEDLSDLEDDNELNISSSSRASVLNSTFKKKSFLSPASNFSIRSQNPSVVAKSTSPRSVFSSAMDLNDLHLNDSFLRHRSPTTNPFLTHMNLDRVQTPRPRSIISPPKLTREVTVDPSWVAGGFWKSPTKRQSPIPNTDFIPIMSRTSSQSSGFESNAPFSRENSVAKEIPDRASVLSEPMFRPQPMYPQRLSTTPRPVVGDSFFNRPTSSLYGSPQDKWRRPSVLGQRGSIFNFKKFSNDLPQF